ncbi:META domain-containing protein [Streptomyces sp. NPDC090106]|uniref:META domain-containing protein n=1 Tax=Streptomyces sp. NPDC090106 TaxID=3365946 RepID=UPI0037F26F34
MKRTTRTTRTTYAVALAGTALLASCGTEPGGDAARSAAGTGVADVEWVPRTVTADGETHALPADVDDARITFAPGGAEPGEAGGASGGSVGCNHIGADVAIDGDTVKVTDLVRTEMACSGPVGRFEDLFVDALAGTHRAAVEDRDGTRTLTLTGSDGEAITLVERTGGGTEARETAPDRHPLDPRRGRVPHPR